MKTEKLDFNHQKLLHDRLKGIGIPISEFSFPNLYLFREHHDYEVIRNGDIFIKGRTYDGYSYIMPTADLRETGLGEVQRLMQDVDYLFPVPEEWLGLFAPERFEYSSLKGDSDYIYTVEKMSTYKGGKLHKKRNLLKQFMTLYGHKDLPLTKERMEDAKEVLEEWQRESRYPKADTDYYPCLESLNLYDELILCGGIYYANKEPAGFIIGEELNEEVFVLHFSKGKKKFKGIYQYMFNFFAKVLPEKYKYLNFEQDMGKEALKLAKSSYVPDFMLKKYRIALK